MQKCPSDSAQFSDSPSLSDSIGVSLSDSAPSSDCPPSDCIGLNRDLIAKGHIRQLAQLRDGAAPDLLDDTQLLASRRAIIPDAGLGRDLLVFAYGSLVWNPCLHFSERFSARLYGFHRRFCLWSTIGRGSPEAPGLVLGLDQGGSAKGMCLRIDKEKIAAEADLLWQREMISASYTPKWVRIHTSKGVETALTFVISKGGSGYAKRMTDEQTADAIAGASGFVGSCAEYLFSTNKALEEAGIYDPHMKQITRLVDARQLAAG